MGALILFYRYNTEAQKERGAVSDCLALKSKLRDLSVKSQTFRSDRDLGYDLGQPHLASRKRIRF